MATLPDEIPVFPAEFNLCDYFLDARLREGRADKLAIIAGSERVSYGEVAERTARLASTPLPHGFNLSVRVLIALSDCAEFAYSSFSILKTGAVVSIGN